MFLEGQEFKTVMSTSRMSSFSSILMFFFLIISACFQENLISLLIPLVSYVCALGGSGKRIVDCILVLVDFYTGFHIKTKHCKLWESGLSAAG